MYANKIRNFVICALVITAVYQTGKLWLEDTTSHNFFYTILGTFDRDRRPVVGESDILLPTQFAVGGGNKKFSVYYPQDENSKPILDQASNFLSEMMSEGTVSQSQEIDWETALQSRCIVFQYPFSLPIEEYTRSFSKLHKIQNLSAFDCFALAPARSAGGTSRVYFINTEQEKSVLVTLNKSKTASSLYTLLEPKESQLIYVSTEQSGFKLFKHNIFVPQWTEKYYPYQMLLQNNPFEKDGVPNRALIENSVDGFFKNLAADWASKRSGTFVFSDESVVVKYEPEGILEYYSYDTYDTKGNTSFLDGYQICYDFMENDKSLNTNVYLSNVRIRSEETIYYFDYEVNGFPVMMSEELRRKLAAEHAIEIVVRNNMVKKYRRYVCNFTPQSQYEGQVSVDFLTALNQAILNYQNLEDIEVVTEVEDIYLGYMADVSGMVGLKWFTELYGYCFVEDTK